MGQIERGAAQSRYEKDVDGYTVYAASWLRRHEAECAEI